MRIFIVINGASRSGKRVDHIQTQIVKNPGFWAQTILSVMSDFLTVNSLKETLRSWSFLLTQGTFGIKY